MNECIANDLAQKLATTIEGLSAEQLHETRAYCAGLTKTNCGWVEYRLAQVVNEVAENETNIRSQE